MFKIMFKCRLIKVRLTPWLVIVFTCSALAINPELLNFHSKYGGYLELQSNLFKDTVEIGTTC